MGGGVRAGGQILAQQGAKLLQDKTLHTQMPVTGTLFFSSHDKRLQRGKPAAKGNITLRKLAAAWPGRSKTRGR
jgi:hypothetical protein